MRRLIRPSDAPQHPPTSSTNEATSTAGARSDVSAVLEAVQYAATSMTSMAERIRELEAHTDAFAASNAQLEEQNSQLATDLGGVVRQRDALTASLAAEGERSRQLEVFAAQQVVHGTTLESDLEATRTSLSQIVEAVAQNLRG